MCYKKLLLCISLVCTITYFSPLQAQEIPISIKTVRNQNNSVDFLYEKNKSGSYTVNIKFTNVTNTSSSDIEKVVQTKSGTLCTLHPIDRNNSIQYSFSYAVVQGNLKAKIDSTYQYLLPFKNGKSHIIYKSNDVNEVYFKIKSKVEMNSYAIKAKTPDSIFAMRKGIVVAVTIKNHQPSYENGLAYTSQRSSVRIEHEDGSYSTYKGFNPTTIVVKEGETVYPSSFLGVINRFNKEEYLLNFDVTYPKKLDLQNKNNKPTITHTYINPFFHTSEGVVQLVDGKEYISDIKETYIGTEMSKKEMKSFLKSK